MSYGSDLSGCYVIGDDSEGFEPPDGMRMGLIPRDYDEHPVGCYGSAPPYSIDDMPLIDWAVMPEMIREMETKKSRLSDIRRRGNNGQPIPSLDQNGQGYCWAYSTTSCVQLLRAVANMPYVPLSAHSVACVIKNFRDQGGWGAASLDFYTTRGCVPQSLWPAKSMSRQWNTEANWQAAKEFRVTEGWVDLQPAVYSRDMSAQQVATCLLNRLPVIGDFNWWGHSVCVMDLVDVYPSRAANDPRRYGTRILNSWRDSWGDLGEGVLKDSKAWPDGGAAPRVAWGG